MHYHGYLGTVDSSTQVRDQSVYLMLLTLMLCPELTCRPERFKSMGRQVIEERTYGCFERLTDMLFRVWAPLIPVLA